MASLEPPPSAHAAPAGRRRGSTWSEARRCAAFYSDRCGARPGPMPYLVGPRPGPGRRGRPAGTSGPMTQRSTRTPLRRRTPGSSRRCTSSTSPTRLGQRQLARVLRRLPGPASRPADRPRTSPRGCPPTAPAAAARRPPPPAAGRSARRGRRRAGDDPGEPIRGAGAAHRRQHGGAASAVPTATQLPQGARPSCSRSTARSSTATWAAPASGKVSFTHLIGYAIVRAIADARAGDEQHLRRGRRRQAAARRATSTSTWASPSTCEKADGSRTLRRAGASATPTRSTSPGSSPRTRSSSARSRPTSSPSTTSRAPPSRLTNPGTIGTVQSVPRLMPGQGVIVGVGSIDYPAEFAGRRPRARSADSASSKVVTITQHLRPPHHPGRRVGHVPQARPRAAARRARLLRGRSSARSACPTRRSSGARTPTRSTAKTRCSPSRCRSPTLIRVHRVRGHLIADLDPLRWKEPTMHPRARPGHLRPHHLGPRPRVPHRRRRRRVDKMRARRPARRAARRVLPHDRRRVHAHPGHRRAAWIQEQVEGRQPELDHGGASASILERLNAAEAFEKFLATKYVGHEAVRHRRAPSRPSRSSTRSSSQAADAELDGAVLGMAHRGRLNVLANIVGKSYDADLHASSRATSTPTSIQGSGDVKYHLGADGQVREPVGRRHRGRAGGQPEPPRDGRPGRDGHGPRRCRTRSSRPGAFPVLPMLIHGDAAFAGQGVVAETLQPVATSRATASAARST